MTHTTPHEPRVLVRGGTGHFHAGCTWSCCVSHVAHDTQADALDEARRMVALAEHGPDDAPADHWPVTVTERHGNARRVRFLMEGPLT